jgi:hypothetical protein
MKRIRFIGVGVLSMGLLAALLTAPYAKSPIVETPVTSNVITQCKTHDIGNVEHTITNRGIYGAMNGPFCPGAPNFEWPAGSDVEFLFGGGLWIGAIVNNDTIVSTGLEGWSVADETGSDFYELFPGDAPGDTIMEAQVVSDQDYIAIYSDTVGFPHAPIHTPLGVEIHQNSYAWSDPDNDDFIIFDYTLYNIDTFNLQDLYVGILMDADIGHTSINNYHMDDVTGFIDTLPIGDTVKIAWARDDDGDGGLSPGVMGIKLLCDEGIQVSYNWWLPNADCEKDLGPWNPSNPNDQKLLQIQQNQCPSDTVPGDPLNDVAKYLLMSNGEFDPDLEDFLNQDTTDIRFLFSFGPFDLPPSDSIQFVFVVGAGDSLDDLAENLMNAEALCGVVGMEESNDEYRTRNIEFRLFKNQPNPFHSSTLVRYQIPNSYPASNIQPASPALPVGRPSGGNLVSLNVYDITGRLVETLVDEWQEAGAYQVEWDGKGRASGIYFVRFSTNNFTTTKKMILIR